MWPVLSSSLSGVAASLLILLASRGDSVVNAAIACGPGWLHYPGVSFALFLLCGTIALYGAFERGWNAAVRLVVFAVGGNVAGLFAFAPAFDAGIETLRALGVDFYQGFFFARPMPKQEFIEFCSRYV